MRLMRRLAVVAACLRHTHPSLRQERAAVDGVGDAGVGRRRQPGARARAVQAGRRSARQLPAPAAVPGLGGPRGGSRQRSARAAAAAAWAQRSRRGWQVARHGVCRERRHQTNQPRVSTVAQLRRACLVQARTHAHNSATPSVHMQRVVGCGHEHGSRMGASHHLDCSGGGRPTQRSDSASSSKHTSAARAGAGMHADAPLWAGATIRIDSDTPTLLLPEC